MLHVQVPLLHVRPHDPGTRQGLKTDWELYSRPSTASTNACIANDVVLVRRLQQWRRLAFQTFRTGLVAIGVLKEDAITATDRRLAVPARVIRKPNSRGGIEHMPLHAAHGNPWCDAAANQPIELIAAAGNQGTGEASHRAVNINFWCRCRIVSGRIPVVCIVILFAVSTEQTNPHPEIQG